MRRDHSGTVSNVDLRLLETVSRWSMPNSRRRRLMIRGRGSAQGWRNRTVAEHACSKMGRSSEAQSAEAAARHQGRSK